MSSFVVYVMRDAAEQVLYVGYSGNLPERLRQHRFQTPWFGQVRSVTVERTADTRREALTLELEVIAEYLPIYNIAGTPRQAERQRAALRRRQARMARAHRDGFMCGDGGCRPCRKAYAAGERRFPAVRDAFLRRLADYTNPVAS